MSFDAGKIEATSHLDNTPFRQGLVELRKLGKEAERNKVTIPVGLDTKKADADVIDFKTRVKRTAGKTNVELVLDNAAATRKLVTFSDRLDAMRAKVTEARVNADTDAAKTRLDALDIQLRRIGLITSRPKVSVEGVERANLQLDALALKLAAVNRGGGGGSGGSGGRGGFFSALGRAGNHAPGFLPLAAGAAAPLIAPAAGLALGAGASLLTPLGAGAIGAGIFGAAAKSSIGAVSKDVEQLDKLTAKYNAATTNKQRAAVLKQESALWKSLDPAQRAAVKNVETLDASWKRFQKKLEPQSFAALAGAARLANTGLHFLLPTAQAVGDEIAILEGKAQHAFTAPFWKQFFGDFLPGEAARSIDTFGTAFGHLLSGGAHLMQDFAPLGHDLENVIVRLTSRFDAWTQGQGPVRFVNWVEQHGPEAANALEGLAHGLKGLGVGLGPIAAIELKALTPVLNFIGDLGEEHPAVITAVGAALLTVGGGLKAIQAAKGIGGAASAIKGLLGGGGGAGGRGGTPANPLYVLDVAKGEGGGGLPGTGGKGKGPGNLPLLALPLTAAYLATQGGDEAPGQKGYVAGGAAKTALAQAIRPFGGVNYNRLPKADQQLYQASFPPEKGGFLGSVSGQEHVNVPSAVAFLQQYNPAALKDLAARYPQVAAAVKDAAKQENVLNHYLAVNTGLAAQAAAANVRFSASIKRAFAGIPSWIRDAEGAASDGGFIIGKNLTAGMIIGIRQGQDKVQITAVQVVKGALHAASKTAELGSPSRVTTRYGRWIAEGLAVGFGQQMPQVQTLFAKHTAGALNRIRTLAQSRLDSARQQLTADQQNRSGYAANVAGNLLGGANLTGAISGNGAVGSLSGYLGGYANSLGVFSSDLARLRKAGLAPALLQQIAEAGPQQGHGLARSILSGASGSIKTLNADYSKISALSTSIGGNVATTVYGAQIARDKKSVDLLARMEKALTALLKESKANPHAVAVAMQQVQLAGHAQTKVTPRR